MFYFALCLQTHKNFNQKIVMKSSIKFLALLVAFAGFSIAAKAQTSTSKATTIEGVRLSIGVESGIPTGNFSDSYKWNLGGSIQADIPLAKPLFLTLNTGYNNFFGKSDSGYPDLHVLPAKAGLKFFPVSNFYIQGEAGADFLLNKSDAGADKAAAFVYAPQIGVQFPVGGKSFIDAGVRYEGTSSYTDGGGSKINYFGIRVAYGFGTK